MALFQRKRTYDRGQMLEKAARAARRRGRRHRRKALELYRQILKNEPDNADLHRKIALLLVKLKDPSNACKSYQQAITALTKRGFFDRAVGVCHEALRHLPRTVPLWEDLAALEVERGRKIDAVEALLRGRRQFRGRRYRADAMELLISAHNIDPVHLAVNFDLASLLARSGERPRALTLLEELITAHPSHVHRIRAKQFRIAPSLRIAWLWCRSFFHAV